MAISATSGAQGALAAYAATLNGGGAEKTAAPQPMKQEAQAPAPKPVGALGNTIDIRA